MPSNPLTDPEWANRSVDFIDRWVQLVRRYTTQPIVTTARGLVFGLLAAFGIVSVIVVLSVGTARGLIAALDAGLSHDQAVWGTYFILSALFFLLGTFLMRKRFKEDDPS
ncbi:MAG: hypothetical protein RLZZ526_1831 [Actinomycetota bacterium]